MRPLLMIRSLSLLALVFLSQACQALPEPKGRGVRVMEVGRLEQVNPNDIVVAPLQMASEEDLRVPELALREAFVEALIRRRYAPLALEYVDSGVVEASYRTGILDEDAVCEIVIHDWDDGMWEGRRAINADLEVRIVDPADPLGPVLWSARVSRRFDFAGDDSEHISEGVQYTKALAHIAQEILAVMPARRTEPGFE